MPGSGRAASPTTQGMGGNAHDRSEKVSSESRCSFTARRIAPKDDGATRRRPMRLPKPPPTRKATMAETRGTHRGTPPAPLLFVAGLVTRAVEEALGLTVKR